VENGKEYPERGSRAFKRRRKSRKIILNKNELMGSQKGKARTKKATIAQRGKGGKGKKSVEERQVGFPFKEIVLQRGWSGHWEGGGKKGQLNERQKTRNAVERKKEEVKIESLQYKGVQQSKEDQGRR